MNKTELIEEVAKVVTSKKEAKAAVECVLDTISNALERREKVALIGFGTFKVSHRRERQGRNPLTGQELRIPAHDIPQFVPGKALKEKVR